MVHLNLTHHCGTSKKGTQVAHWSCSEFMSINQAETRYTKYFSFYEHMPDIVLSFIKLYIFAQLMMFIYSKKYLYLALKRNQLSPLKEN